MAVVEIAEEVWREWEVLRDRDEPVVLLRFEPTGDLSEAARAIREAVTQVTDSFGARLDASDDMDSSWAGEWSWLRVADGVLVNVIESEFFAEILPEVARALEHRGIEGTFRLWDEYTDITAPSIAHHVECRIRARGKRVRHELRGYRWQPDADAQAAVLLAADQWCRRQPGTTVCSIRKDTFGLVRVSAGEVLADRMTRATLAELRKVRGRGREVGATLGPVSERPADRAEDDAGQGHDADTMDAEVIPSPSGTSDPSSAGEAINEKPLP